MHLKLNVWLTQFLIDYSVYKGQLDDALNYIKQKQDQYSPLKRNLRTASIQYLKKNYYVRITSDNDKCYYVFI